MDREQTLSLLKDSIVGLQKNSKLLCSSEDYRSKYNRQVTKIHESINTLSEEDKEWLEAEYRKWFKDKVLPMLPSSAIDTFSSAGAMPSKKY